MKIDVTAQWDATAGVWSAVSDDYFGLITEGSSLEDLVEQIILTFADLWTHSGEPLPESVTFNVECIKQPKRDPFCNLNVCHVPDQLAMA